MPCGPATGIGGPAILEEREATTVIPPGDRLAVDDGLNLSITIGEGQKPIALVTPGTPRAEAGGATIGRSDRPRNQPTSAGVVQPHSLMLAAIAATCASVWVRAFLAYGISRSIDHRSTLSAGHGF
jgi:hypothetical protein